MQAYVYALVQPYMHEYMARESRSSARVCVDALPRNAFLIFTYNAHLRSTGGTRLGFWLW